MAEDRLYLSYPSVNDGAEESIHLTDIVDVVTDIRPEVLERIRALTPAIVEDVLQKQLSPSDATRLFAPLMDRIGQLQNILNVEG